MKKRTNNTITYLFSIVVLIFTACKSFRLGEYQDNQSSAVIVLKNDSTFKYNSFRNNFEHSSGVWERKDNHIILNSFLQNKVPTIKILKYKSITLKEGIYLKININPSNKNDVDFFCEAFTNNGILLFDPMYSLKSSINQNKTFDIIQLSKDIQSKNGSYSFTVNQHIDSIYFKLWKFPQNFNGKYFNDSLQTERKKIAANLGDSIDVVIDLNDSLFGYKIFDNKGLKINNRLLFFENKKFKLKRTSKS